MKYLPCPPFVFILELDVFAFEEKHHLHLIAASLLQISLKIIVLKSRRNPGSLDDLSSVLRECPRNPSRKAKEEKYESFHS